MLSRQLQTRCTHIRAIVQSTDASSDALETPGDKQLGKSRPPCRHFPKWRFDEEIKRWRFEHRRRLHYLGNGKGESEIRHQIQINDLVAGPRKTIRRKLMSVKDRVDYFVRRGP